MSFCTFVVWYYHRPDSIRCFKQKKLVLRCTLLHRKRRLLPFRRVLLIIRWSTHFLVSVRRPLHVEIGPSLQTLIWLATSTTWHWVHYEDGELRNIIVSMSMKHSRVSFICKVKLLNKWQLLLFDSSNASITALRWWSQRFDDINANSGNGLRRQRMRVESLMFLMAP